MPQVELVVIGASAGGLPALLDIVAGLPATLSTPIVIVVHTKAEADSLLPQILSRKSALRVQFAANGPLKDGQIYIAPPNRHVLITAQGLQLNSGPRENGFRPAVDPLFRTAARVHGSGVMGIILSGAMDDGTYGLKLVKDAGGIAVVQDPAEASFPGMPLSAMRFVTVDHVLPAVEIAALIANSSGTSDEGEVIMARQKEPEPQNPAEETDVGEMEREYGRPSGLTCPDCGGALWDIEDGELTRFRCHVGHQFTTEALDAEQQNAVEGALWSAVRVLEEHAELRKRLASRAEASGFDSVSSGFSRSAHDSQQQAHTIRELLFGRVASPPRPEPAPARSRATRSTNGKGSRTNGKGRKTRQRAT